MSGNVSRPNEETTTETPTVEEEVESTPVVDEPGETSTETKTIELIEEPKVALNCPVCKGEGLQDERHLCPACGGTGKQVN